MPFYFPSCIKCRPRIISWVLLQTNNNNGIRKLFTRRNKGRKVTLESKVEKPGKHNLGQVTEFNINSGKSC